MHETSAGQYLKIDITPNITAELDANSSITVLKTDPPRVELLKGDIFFNVKSPSIEQTNIEVILGDAVIQSKGGSFSSQRKKDHIVLRLYRSELKSKHSIRRVLSTQVRKLNLIIPESLTNLL